MKKRRINPRLIKLHRIYSVEEAGSALGVHKNSVRNWIKAGLPTIDDRRPTLMMGSELRKFLEAKHKARRRPCAPGHFHCFKCRDTRRPAAGMVDFMAGKSASGNLTGLCEICGTVMYRRARLALLPVIMPNLDVQIREAELRLIGRASLSLNCDNGRD